MRWRQNNDLHRSNGPIDFYLVTVWNDDTDEVVYNELNRSQSATRDTLFVNSLDPYNNYMCSVSLYGRNIVGIFGVIPIWIPETGKSIRIIEYYLIT